MSEFDHIYKIIDKYGKRCVEEVGRTDKCLSEFYLGNCEEEAVVKGDKGDLGLREENVRLKEKIVEVLEVVETALTKRNEEVKMMEEYITHLEKENESLLKQMDKIKDGLVGKKDSPVGNGFGEDYPTDELVKQVGAIVKSEEKKELLDERATPMLEGERERSLSAGTISMLEAVEKISKQEEQESNFVPFLRNKTRGAYFVGASLVVCQRKSDGKFLLTQEKSGKFWFPGGGVKINEGPIEAAKREAFEETGIDVNIKGILKFTNKLSSDGSYHQRIIFFAHPMNDNQKLKDVADEETLKGDWCSLSKLKQLIKKGKRRMRNMEPIQFFERIENDPKDYIPISVFAESKIDQSFVQSGDIKTLETKLVQRFTFLVSYKRNKELRGSYVVPQTFVVCQRASDQKILIFKYKKETHWTIPSAGVGVQEFFQTAAKGTIGSNVHIKGIASAEFVVSQFGFTRQKFLYSAVLKKNGTVQKPKDVDEMDWISLEELKDQKKNGKRVFEKDLLKYLSLVDKGVSYKLIGEGIMKEKKKKHQEQSFGDIKFYQKTTKEIMAFRDEFYRKGKK